MCGIAGVFAYGVSARAVDPRELAAMSEHMRRRGPDGSGEWLSLNGRVGLGHRRLAIIDLSDRAAQPMHSDDGTLVVVFNGEIYNHRELREELIRKGTVFRTTSDTEVLIHLYRERGEAMVPALRGMFAFAIWDAKREGLFLARDPYGIKPFYYASEAGVFRFASQVRALLSTGQVSRDPDPAGQVGFYLFGSVPEPHTTYRHIRSLRAGTSLWVDASGPGNEKTHFSIEACWSATLERDAGAVPSQELQALSRRALVDSVAQHMVADVPVGAFLSSGVDSSALVSLMRECGAEQLKAVTLSFPEFAGQQDDEVRLAQVVARHCGVEHHVRTVDHGEFLRDLPAILEAMDQPTIDGMNSWFVSKAAAEVGLKVAISGLGGDELFGGYPAFEQVPSWVRWLRVPASLPGLGRGLRTLLAPGMSRQSWMNPKLAGMVEYGGSYAGAYLLKRALFMPWELTDILPADLVHEGLHALDPVRHLDAMIDPGPASGFGKVAVLETCHYMRNQLLRDTDWASMAHSLEVRLPLVDHRLLQQLAAPLAAASQVDGKTLLSGSLATSLPTEVLRRTKTGFSIPIQRWLEQSPELDAWRKVPTLARTGCHWARRLAYAIGELQLDQ